jgi:hypothetical protein
MGEVDSRTQFKARFRRHFDVREILSEDKFVNNIVEHMWLAWQASREALVVKLPQKFVIDGVPVVTTADLQRQLDKAGIKSR